MPNAQRELTLLLTDLYLAGDLRESLAESLAEAPALPALERLVARAHSGASGEWRRLALTLTDTALPDPVPVAALSRIAGTGAAPPDGQWWVASAVHLRAAHDHVQLSEVLSLSAPEWEQLLTGFNATFGAQTGTLELGHDSEAYLRLAPALEAQGVDPERVAGSDVHDALPGGRDGAAIRRLMTELQMWLHDHPLNALREQRGAAAVSGLWLWGAGEMPARLPVRALPALVTQDWFLRGLWALRAATRLSATHAGPATIQAVERAIESNPLGSVVGLALRDQRADNWLQRLVVLDRDWIAPALALLRAGRVDLLRLQAGDCCFTLRARDLWRIWRRRRSWFEAIA